MRKEEALALGNCEIKKNRFGSKSVQMQSTMTHVGDQRPKMLASSAYEGAY